MAFGYLVVMMGAYVGGDPPHIDSVHDLFPPANWDERETYDMFGVVFDNHPDLTRILMPDDWVGHPLRRDYPVGGEVVVVAYELDQSHKMKFNSTKIKTE